MRKKLLLVFALLLVLALVAPWAMRKATKRHSPEAEVSFSKSVQGRPGEPAKSLAVSVEYCRPSKKGREIFGGLVPWGEVWRTGANEATEIEIDRDVLFGGVELAAGRYVLFTIPGEEEWTIILNEVLGQWGAFQYDDSRDVLRVSAEPSMLDDPVEMFTIDVVDAGDGLELRLLWDMTSVAVPIALAADSS